MHVSQAKHAALMTSAGVTEGNIDHLEGLYLVAKGATAGKHVNDQWMEVFLANGATSPNWNLAASEFLVARGFSGNISDMWHSFWDGDGVIV